MKKTTDSNSFSTTIPKKVKVKLVEPKRANVVYKSFDELNEVFKQKYL